MPWVLKSWKWRDKSHTWGKRYTKSKKMTVSVPKVIASMPCVLKSWKCWDKSHTWGKRYQPGDVYYFCHKVLELLGAVRERRTCSQGRKKTEKCLSSFHTMLFAPVAFSSTQSIVTENRSDESKQTWGTLMRTSNQCWSWNNIFTSCNGTLFKLASCSPQCRRFLRARSRKRLLKLEKRGENGASQKERGP